MECFHQLTLQMEPTRPTACAIMSPLREAQAER